MQYTDTPPQPAIKETNSNRLRFIAVSLGLAFLLLIVFALFRIDNSEETVSIPYTDPITGETVIDPVGKTDESYGVDSADPTLLGFNKLLELGFTDFQLEALIRALDEYAAEVELTPNEISLYPDSPAFADVPDTSSAIDIVSFDIQTQRQDKRIATVTRNSLSAITLSIQDMSGNNLFQSGVIDALVITN